MPSLPCQFFPLLSKIPRPWMPPPCGRQGKNVCTSPMNAACVPPRAPPPGPRVAPLLAPRCPLLKYSAHCSTGAARYWSDHVPPTQIPVFSLHQNSPIPKNTPPGLPIKNASLHSVCPRGKIPPLAITFDAKPKKPFWLKSCYSTLSCSPHDKGSNAAPVPHSCTPPAPV